MTTMRRARDREWRWEPPEHHATLDSTNTRALQDPRPGRVVVADHQSAGQGRRGRTWSSPPGTGMAITAVVPALPPAVVGWVPLCAGLAVARALAGSRWPVEAVLKWPNDVLLQGPRPGKVCGVLAQVAAPGAAPGTGPGAVVVGAGLNVDHEEDQLPVPTATSWRLARGGAPLPERARTDLLADYLRELAALHDRLADGGVEQVRAAYLRRCSTVGQQVVVHRPGGGRSTGLATGVDEDGALLVRDAGGTAAHHAGDVEHVRAR